MRHIRRSCQWGSFVTSLQGLLSLDICPFSPEGAGQDYPEVETACATVNLDAAEDTKTSPEQLLGRAVELVEAGSELCEFGFAFG